MLRFLFWNLARKPIESLVQRIAKVHEIDVIILAETAAPPWQVATALTGDSLRRPFHYAPPSTPGHKVYLFARFDANFIKPVFDTPRMTVRRLALPGRDDILVAGVHLASKLHVRDEQQQGARAVELARDLREQEDRIGHRRTIFVGDLNMNPFESSVAGAPGLNAVMARQIARPGERIVESRSHPFFYNPMWNHFGEQGRNPPGTFYYKGSTHLWNMFDQVLVRPALMDRFVDEDLTVLTAIGSHSLVTEKGHPNPLAASDHLPLLFSLNI